MALPIQRRPFGAPIIPATPLRPKLPSTPSQASCEACAHNVALNVFYATLQILRVCWAEKYRAALTSGEVDGLGNTNPPAGAVSSGPTVFALADAILNECLAEMTSDQVVPPVAALRPCCGRKSA